jgi:4-hydroxybenzoate polyprenyltransferase
MTGRQNIAFGFLFMGLFMLYGFLLIYLRDFAPDKEAWIANDSAGPHFESRLAHVHGNLFAFLNIVIGFVLLKSRMPERKHRTISWIALSGMLMPVGILLEIYLQASPVFVLIGAVLIVLAVVLMGLYFLRTKEPLI